MMKLLRSRTDSLLASLFSCNTPISSQRGNPAHMLSWLLPVLKRSVPIPTSAQVLLSACGLCTQAASYTLAEHCLRGPQWLSWITLSFRSSQLLSLFPSATTDLLKGLPNLQSTALSLICILSPLLQLLQTSTLHFSHGCRIHVFSRL